MSDLPQKLDIKRGDIADLDLSAPESAKDPLEQLRAVKDEFTTENESAEALGEKIALATQDEFYSLFCLAFSAPEQARVMISQAVGRKAKPLETLVKVKELESSRPASDALYSFIIEVEWLHFLIQSPLGKFSERSERLAPILAFVWELASGVSSELAIRQPESVPSRRKRLG
jgi:hypothetical protein